MKDRRLHHRTPCQLQVESACGRLRGRATNINEQGFYMQCRGNGDFRVGEQFVLRLGLGESSLEAVGNVVSIHDELFYRATSVQFTRLPDKAREQIQSYQQAKRKKTPSPMRMARIPLIRRPALQL